MIGDGHEIIPGPKIGSLEKFNRAEYTTLYIYTQSKKGFDVGF